MDFTGDLNQATFPISTFQNITFSDPTITTKIFNISYSWTSPHSYRILLTPLSAIFIYNVTTTVTTMLKPSPVHVSTDGIPFAANVYTKSDNIKWFLIKGTGWSKQ